MVSPRRKLTGIKSSKKRAMASGKRPRRKRARPIPMENPPQEEIKSTLPAGPPQPEPEDQEEPTAPLAAASFSNNKPPPLSTHTPVAVAFRHIRPFWRNYIQYVDLAARGGDDRAKKYLAVWNRITQSERRHHFPEQLCELACILPHELVEMVCGQLFLMETAEASMVTAFAKKEVIQAARYFGTTFESAFKDREFIGKVSGALPIPKGATVNLNMQGAVGGGSQSPAQLTPKGQVLDMDAEIIGLSEVLELPAAGSTSFIPEEDDEEPDDDDEDDDE